MRRRGCSVVNDLHAGHSSVVAVAAGERDPAALKQEALSASNPGASKSPPFVLLGRVR